MNTNTDSSDEDRTTSILAMLNAASSDDEPMSEGDNTLTVVADTGTIRGKGLYTTKKIRHAGVIVACMTDPTSRVGHYPNVV